MDHGRSASWFLGAGQHHMGHGDVEHYWWAIAEGLRWEGYMGRLIHPFAPGNLIRKTSEFPAVNFFLWTKRQTPVFCVNCLWCMLGGGVGGNQQNIWICQKQHGDIMGFLMGSFRLTDGPRHHRRPPLVWCWWCGHPVFNPPKLVTLGNWKLVIFFWIHFTVRLFSHTFESCI